MSNTTYLSSPMRWCESKQIPYAYFDNIIETENAFSSLAFIGFALYGGFMHNNELTKIGWFLMANIGLTSFWFHTTLSEAGQLADELSILLMGFYITSNITFKFTYINNYSIYIQQILYIFYITLSGATGYICIYHPSISPYIMLIEGGILIIPTVIYIHISYIRKRIFIQAIKSFFIASLFWYLDNFCIFNAHLYWHIFISYSTYLFVLTSIDITNNNSQITNSQITNSYTQIIYKDELIPYWLVKKYQHVNN